MPITHPTRNGSAQKRLFDEMSEMKIDSLERVLKPGFVTETTNQDFSDLRKNLIEPEEAKPDDEKVMIIAVSSNQGFSGSMDGDDCGLDCSHDICAC
ncbi:hypothetical protein Bca101_095045 [Brassica carinata]